MMWRAVGVACALGLAAVPARGMAAAGEAKTPSSAAREKTPSSAGARSAAVEACTPHQRVACEGVERHAIEGDLDCRACDPAPMPPEVTEPPTAPARPLACGAREMPLSPPLPGCLPPPADRLPPL